MSHWILLLYLITAALLIWYLVNRIRHNSQAFSKENIGKSFYTVGLLTLLLLVIVILGVLFLRQ